MVSVERHVKNPWRMRLFFGTAVERRVAELAARDDLLSVLRHTEPNAPQDFIDPGRLDYDITGSSKSSIRTHYGRPEVDVVVTYDSIPDDYGYDWSRWYLDE